MSLQSLGVRTTQTLIAQPCFGVHTPATTQAAILECAIMNALLVTQSVGLGRPDTLTLPAVGTSQLFQQDDPTDPASVVYGLTTWVVPPTSPIVFHRRWNVLPFNGIGVIWTFPRGLIIDTGSAMVLWNVTVGSPLDVTMVLDA